VGITLLTLKLIDTAIRNRCGAKNHYPKTSDYTPSVTTFHTTVGFSKFLAKYILRILSTRLEKITKQHKTHLHVTHTIKLRFPRSLAYGQTSQQFSP